MTWLRLHSPPYDAGFIELGVLPPEGEVLPNNHPCCINGWEVVAVSKGEGGVLRVPPGFRGTTMHVNLSKAGYGLPS